MPTKRTRLPRKGTEIDEALAVVHLAYGDCLLARKHPTRCACGLEQGGDFDLDTAKEIYQRRRDEVAKLAKRYRDGTYDAWITNFIDDDE